MAEAPARVLLAGGRAYSLPADAVPVAAGPLRPVPLAAPGLLGLGVVGGQVLPVLAAAPGLPGGPAWVMLEGATGRVVIAGEALDAMPAEGAAPLAVPRIAARRAPPPLPAGPGSWAVPMRGGASRPAMLAAGLGKLRLVLPFALVERVVDMPALCPAPDGSARDRSRAIARGYAVAAGAPVLVLEPGWLAGGPVSEKPDQEHPDPQEPGSLLVLFRHGGRRLGLPAARIEPARPGEASLLPRLEAMAEHLAMAPLAAVVAPPAPEPMRSLLLCVAGGLAFALPVEEVQAVIPPMAPTPTPTPTPTLAPGGASGMAGPGSAFRGIVAHRGDVLPVLDAGLRMGLPAVLDGQRMEAPLLRLVGPRPVALAVAQVTGLRQVPEHLVAPVAGEGLVSAVASLGDAPLPVCRAAVLAGGSGWAGGAGWTGWAG